MAIRHLAEVVREHGSGDEQATSLMVAMIENGLAIQRARKDADRAAQGKAGAKDVLYVTELGKECERAVALSFTDAPQDALTTDSLINFGVGSVIEDWLAGLLAEGGAEILREASVVIHVPVLCEECGPVSVQVRGRIDYLATIPVPDEVADALGIPRGSVIAIECKSDKSRSAARRLEHGLPGDHSYVIQLKTYLYALRRGLVKGGQIEGESVSISGDELIARANIDYGILNFVVKDQTRREPGISAYFIEADDEQIEAVLDSRATLAHRALVHGEVPEVPIAYEAVAQFMEGYRMGNEINGKKRYIRGYRIDARRDDIARRATELLAKGNDRQKILAGAYAAGLDNLTEMPPDRETVIQQPFNGQFPCAYCSFSTFCWPANATKTEVEDDDAA